MDLKRITWMSVIFLLAVATIFNEGSPIVKFMGLELVSTIAMLVGIAYFAIEEAISDYEKQEMNIKITHGDSAVLRIIGVFLGMVALDFHMHLYWSYFLLNMGMFLGAYSLIFNLQLSWLREKRIFDYISKFGKSKYDKIFYYLAFKNGHAAGVLKVLFDASAVTFLFATEHFGINMPDVIKIIP